VVRRPVSSVQRWISALSGGRPLSRSSARLLAALPTQIRRACASGRIRELVRLSPAPRSAHLRPGGGRSGAGLLGGV